MLLSIKTCVLLNDWFFFLFKSETKQVPGWQKKQKPFQPRDLRCLFPHCEEVRKVRDCWRQWWWVSKQLWYTHFLPIIVLQTKRCVVSEGFPCVCEHGTHRVATLNTQCTHTESVTSILTHNVHTHPVNHLKPHTQCTHTHPVSHLKPHTQCTHTHPVSHLKPHTHIITSSLTHNVHTDTVSHLKPHTQHTHVVIYTHTVTSSLPPLPQPPQPLFTSKGANSYWHSPHPSSAVKWTVPLSPSRRTCQGPSHLSRSGVHEGNTEDRWAKAKIGVQSHKSRQLPQPTSVHQVNPSTSTRSPPPVFDWQAFIYSTGPFFQWHDTLHFL